jgi:predicted flap endonuclease-1-like 5' DNA nuclease
MAKLESIEGIGPEYAAKLRAAGVGTIEDLLEKGSTPSSRKAIERDTGLSGKLVLEWVNRADLARIKGIGEEYADLLESAGVDTVPELAQRNADNLYDTMVQINEKKNLVRRLPAREDIKKWVSQAKKLPRKVTY